MRFRAASAEIFLVDMPFRFRFRHAAAERSANQTLYLRLTSADGKTGWGEGLTRSYLTGETPESVFIAVEHWWPQVKALAFSVDSPRQMLHPMWQQAGDQRQTAAWSLIDIACYDLWLRHGGRTELTGMSSFPVTFPLGLGGGRLLPRLARLRGFRRIKIKTGPDVASLEAALSAAGAGWEQIGVDANGCFAAADLIDLSTFLRAKGVAFIEQPFPPQDTTSAVSLVRDKTAAVVADESLCTEEDAHRLISARAADVFNIRLAKNGGITGALTLADIANAHGIRIQLGALVGESELLANAARFCLPAVRPSFYEYSFPKLLLRRAFVRSDLPVFSPALTSANFSGLGFGDVNESALRRAAVRTLRLD